MEQAALGSLGHASHAKCNKSAIVTNKSPGEITGKLRIIYLPLTPRVERAQERTARRDLCFTAC